MLSASKYQQNIDVTCPNSTTSVNFRVEHWTNAQNLNLIEGDLPLCQWENSGQIWK